jgi:hypothetical protein
MNDSTVSHFDWQEDASREYLDRAVYYVRPVVLEVVRQFEPLTFAGLLKLLAPLRRVINLDGPEAIVRTRGIMLWGGMGSELAESIRQLLSGNLLYLHPADVSAYVNDGIVPLFPLATNPIRGYDDDDPHWLPVFLRTTPFAS